MLTKKASKLWYSLIVMSALLLIGGTLFLPTRTTAQTIVPNDEYALAYIPHDPIHINSNAEFLSQDAVEGWPGDGSPGNPIIISGYSFTAADHMLRVNNSDLHFRFEDNQLDGLAQVWCGIAIVDSANGVIRNNFVRRAAAGIHVVTVENMTIQGNDVQDSTFGGIVVEDGSINVSVIGNTVYDNENCGIFLGNPYGSEPSVDVRVLDNIVHSNGPSGIDLVEVTNCLVENNTVYSNNVNGIIVESGSNTIRNNTISSCIRGIMLTGGNSTISGNEVTNAEYGFYVGCEDNTISNNYLAHNSKTGIRFYYLSTEGIGGSNNIVIENVIANNSRWGLEFLTDTENNLVQHNDFLMNGYTAQAYDDGTSNTFAENYWDDWTGPDDDLDGFVDTPYSINGTADNSDAYPLAANCNPLPSWYTTPPSTTPTGTTPSPVDPLLIAIGAGVVVVVLLAVIIVKKR